MNYQQIASKMIKTLVIKKNMKIVPYIPDTYWYTAENVRKILDRYGSAFLKPDKGDGGGGAIKLVRQSNGKILCKTFAVEEIVNPIQVSSWVVKRILANQKYIVQQGIDLAQVKGRPFDIRIHLQKPESRWIISGTCAKVAPVGRIVTNHCQGSTPQSLDSVILQICSYDSAKAKRIIEELHTISYDISQTLNNQFKGLKELGVDIGIDKQLKIWIFEVNTRPCPNMFKELSDVSMYQKIIKTRREIIAD